MKKTRTNIIRAAAAGSIALAAVAIPLAPASADWSTWTPRQGWCAIWPSFCR